MKDLFKFRLPIQLFAADTGTNGAGEVAGDTEGEETPTVSFNQSDVDRALQADINCHHDTNANKHILVTRFYY